MSSPFATLALVQNTGGGGGGGGGAYMRDATISLTITPFLPGIKSLSVGVETKHWASPSVRRRDAHDASGRLTFSVEERGSRVLLPSSWHVHH